VYKARDLLNNNKIVALKRVRFDLSDLESVKFMAREIIVMRKLDHPNVLKLQGLITASLSSSLYLFFEYMDHDLVGLASIPGIKFSQPQVLTEDYWRKLKLPPSAPFKPALPYRRRVAEMFKDLPMKVLSLLEALLSIDPEQGGSAAIPFACDPSSLPKYPPSKEIEMKRRGNKAAMENPYLRRCVPGHSTRQMQISNNAASGRVS
ncbi:hypothetical protein HID58_006605, partial [Brassica napus]